MNKLGLIITGLSLCSSFAFANQAKNNLSATQNLNHPAVKGKLSYNIKPFVGGYIGIGQASGTDLNNSVIGKSINGLLSYNVHAGAYFMQYSNFSLGAEIGVGYGGKSVGATKQSGGGSVEMSQLSVPLLLDVKYSFTQIPLSLVFKPGISFNKVNIKYDPYSVDKSKSSNSLIFGFSANYVIKDNFVLTAGFDMSKVKYDAGGTNEKFNLASFNLGFEYMI